VSELLELEAERREVPPTSTDLLSSAINKTDDQMTYKRASLHANKPNLHVTAEFTHYCPQKTTGGYSYIMLSANMHQYFTWKCFT